MRRRARLFSPPRAPPGPRLGHLPLIYPQRLPFSQKGTALTKVKLSGKFKLSRRLYMYETVALNSRTLIIKSDNDQEFSDIIDFVSRKDRTENIHSLLKFASENRKIIKDFKFNREKCKYMDLPSGIVSWLEAHCFQTVMYLLVKICKMD
jgi:hypothetical protein